METEDGNATDSYTIIICWNCATPNYIYPFGFLGKKEYCIVCGEEL